MFLSEDGLKEDEGRDSLVTNGCDERVSCELFYVEYNEEVCSQALRYYVLERSC